MNTIPEIYQKYFSCERKPGISLCVPDEFCLIFRYCVVNYPVWWFQPGDKITRLELYPLKGEALCVTETHTVRIKFSFSDEQHCYVERKDNPNAV